MKIVNDKQINEFLMGNDSYLYDWLGSKLIYDDKGNIVGTMFRIYAPNAKEVRLISGHNNFEGWKHVLTKVSHHGIFEITIPENLEWISYKYEIHLHNGNVLYKTDPFGFYSDLRPSTNSRVYEINDYKWHDQDWFKNKQKPYDEPMLIYEVHLGSWRRDNGAFPKYNEIVEDLITHVKDHGFTHIELMPIYEYPLDASWGYQGVGFFSATSRYGSPKDLMYFIDRMHQEGIGVIIDWVLGHICRDAHGISFFDGTPLFEFDDKHRRENITWGTNNLDFSKGITRSFMLSALSFWVRYFHVDGFRIDAVSNLLYYLGNRDEGTNEDAVNFIKQAGYHLFGIDDRIIFAAEDSTDFPKVTHPVDQGGIGFNYKWNMGFMNDTLKYFKEDPINRKYNHDKITFGMMYTYNEQFIIPYSHDEVVHMKGSLLNKMPGDYFQKFANWRLLMTLFMTHPGKKLLFMGQEFASFSEWDFDSQLDWNLFEYESHKKANDYFKALAHVYRNSPALFKYDHDPKGFKWLVVNDKQQSVFAYSRHSDDETIVVVINMTPNVHFGYEIGVSQEGVYEEILNSDRNYYFGSNIYNGINLQTFDEPRLGYDQHLKVTIGPLAATILRLKK